jgi:Putative metallopeptidase
MHHDQCGDFRTRVRHCSACVFVWLCLAAPAAAQSALEKELDQRVTEIAAMIEDYPRVAGLTSEEKRKLVEFTAGNLLFVLGHEAGHMLISELGIPVIGREEDGADSFSTLMALKIGATYADRVLVNAATGWFYSDRRNRQDRVKMVYYDEHGIDLQRAYNIVCLMVGSNPERFSGLADEVRIPEERQGTCLSDYSNAAWSWNKVLEPHRRQPTQPKTEIRAVYGPAEKDLALFKEATSRMKILEMVAGLLSEQYVLRRPITLELQTCGAPGARWDLTAKAVIICYEIVQEFAQLYRSYRKVAVSAMADDETAQLAANFHSAAE